MGFQPRHDGCGHMNMGSLTKNPGYHYISKYLGKWIHQNLVNPQIVVYFMILTKLAHSTIGEYWEEPQKQDSALDIK